MSDKKLLVGLVIFILLLITIGSVGLYSFYKSNEKVLHYCHAAKEAKDVLTIYHAQMSIWKDMLQSKENAPSFHKSYYEFSKLSDRIQDGLFNLKIRFIVEEDDTWEKIEQIRTLHQKASEKYVSVIFDKKIEALSIDPLTIMNEYETTILNGLENSFTSSMNLANKEIVKTKKLYLCLMSAFLAILTALAIIMTVMIIKGKRG
jgi:hypothetical protein